MIRAEPYLEAIDQRLTAVRARPEVVADNLATARIDRHYCFGQVADCFAIGVAIAKAREHGMSAVALVRSSHVGRLDDYVELAAAEGMLALGFCTVTGTDGWVAPFGSKDPVFGTNPFTVGIPSAEAEPVVLDFTTSAVAEGKLQMALKQGRVGAGGVAAHP